ncbi:glycosyltransferase [Pedobacter roseus]|uniref:Glycosyltransferase n=1 Tax=Pedobacter roseus TaxID=336820 RepID=A0A7G9QKT1_9SPHI|nr:glycosyltransferase [Pedobacter roseus]QNN43956.1 glycosyltransferase [Pedobacter roseus]
MKNPILSVIIPTYNRKGLLDHTLMSITNQKIDLETIEVIIADDGSTDNTEELVEKYSGILNISYYYQEDEGYRVASARNLGITNANGEILFFVDSGILLSKDCISQHISSHKGSLNSVVIGTVLGVEEEYDNNKTLLKQIDLSAIENTIAKIQSENIYLDIREKVFKSCLDNLMSLKAPWALCWTGNLSLRRSMLIEVGEFDIAFDKNWGVEDIDLGYRLFLKGAFFKLNRLALSLHYPHYSDTRGKLEQEKINKRYFDNKHQILASRTFLSCTAICLNDKLDVLESIIDEI